MSSILTVCMFHAQPEAGPSDDELYLDYCDFQIASALCTELVLRLDTREKDGGA